MGLLQFLECPHLPCFGTIIPAVSSVWKAFSLTPHLANSHPQFCTEDVKDLRTLS